MGEIALLNGERIKIGTCESMYYIRFEDRLKVEKVSGSIDPSNEIGLYWRLPFEDEDSVAIGSYEIYNRGYRLYQMDEHGYARDFIDEVMADHPGIIQLRHDSGLLLNVPCYHGLKLPEVAEGSKAFWNGKSWSIELKSIKNTNDGLRPITECRHCRQIWSHDWDEILPFVHGEMKERLEAYRGL